MPKKKKKFIKKLATTGLTLGASSLALGALPTNTVTPNVTAGFAKFSTAFPIIGKLGGVAMTIDATGKVVKATKKLKGGQK